MDTCFWGQLLWVMHFNYKNLEKKKYQESPYKIREGPYDQEETQGQSVEIWSRRDTTTKCRRLECYSQKIVYSSSLQAGDSIGLRGEDSNICLMANTLEAFTKNSLKTTRRKKQWFLYIDCSRHMTRDKSKSFKTTKEPSHLKTTTKPKSRV